MLLWRPGGLQHGGCSTACRNSCSEPLTEKNDFKRRLHDAQIPAPLAGHSLAWGCRFNRGFAESIQELARFLMNEPELMDISLIRANITLDSLHRIAARYGFEAIRKPVRFSPLEGVHR